MNNWRDQILKEFTPHVARLTLVADPDGLLLEEETLEYVRKRGFELIPFDDRIAFRYAYESKFRLRWDRGEHADLIVVLRSHPSDLSVLPYDLLHTGRRVTFNLSDVFPNLSYRVVSALDRVDLDALYESQKRHAPGQLGDNATKEFVLRHVFEIAPELIKRPSDLLRVLLRRHYRGQRMPTDLDQRFIQLLRQSDAFDDWPLERLVTDREAFFTFLQERWPIFLDRKANKGASGARENKKLSDLALDEPVLLPFEHDDIRIYIDTLFVEGLLHPIEHEHSKTLSKSWAGIGVKTPSTAQTSPRLGKLLERLQTSMPEDNARHTDWIRFARGWAEMILVANDQTGPLPETTGERIKTLQMQVDAAFSAWLVRRYAGLVNLPPVPPVMLHHLPRFLARQLEDDRSSKIALVVVDGLAMDQWLVIRHSLAERQMGFQFRERAVFAWIPTLTSVSRQATFAGKAPIFFPNSIQTTGREHARWAQFWTDQGYMENEVVYIKGLGDGSLDFLSEALSHPKARVAALIVNKVDKIMHGMELGSAGMHNQVRQWADQPDLCTLLDVLLRKAFRVFLTSDHGNIEAKGCGRPTEGVMADLRGQRVRVYPNATLRRLGKHRFSDSIEWPAVGLPEEYLALLAPHREAFVPLGQRTVSHGGNSIEEVIVPLVEIERKEQNQHE